MGLVERSLLKGVVGVRVEAGGGKRLVDERLACVLYLLPEFPFLSICSSDLNLMV